MYHLNKEGVYILSVGKWGNTLKFPALYFPLSMICCEMGTRHSLFLASVLLIRRINTLNRQQELYIQLGNLIWEYKRKHKFNVLQK